MTRQLHDICPHCGANLLGELIAEEGGARYWRRSIGVEISGVYDGVLFTACPDCWGTWNRWDPIYDSRLWVAAEKHRTRFTQDMTIKGDPF